MVFRSRKPICPETSWTRYRSALAQTSPTGSGPYWNRCCPCRRAPRRAGHRSGPSGNSSTASGGASGPAPRGATFRNVMMLGPLADRVRHVPPLATRRRVAPRPVPATGPRGRGRSDRLGRVGGLRHLPGPPARRRGSKKGDLQKEPPSTPGAIERNDHALGKSRGGWTTKTHLACEQGQKALSVIITAGQRGDSPQFIPVLKAINVPRLGPGRPRRRPDRMLADKAYSSKANRDYLRCHDIKATIPIKTDQAANRRKKGGRRRTTPHLRTRHLQTTPRRRVRHRPPQTQPRRRHPLRQTRRPIRRHRPHSSDQRVAPTRLMKQAQGPLSEILGAPRRPTPFSGMSPACDTRFSSSKTALSPRQA